jgi:D-glycero-alpha-D-manno-heptose-7-phosphate kinase
MAANLTFTPGLNPTSESRSGPNIIRARTPLRISFAGGGTDFPHWFEAQPGAVLCITVTQYARVTLYPREDREVRIRSVDLGYTVNYKIDERPLYDGMLDLAKAAIHRLGCTRGLDLDVHSDSPPGSGLGGSSALVSSVIGAVAAYQNRVLDLYELADLNYKVEREDMSISGGMQDQYGTTFGGLNLIEFAPTGVLVNPLRLNESVLADLEAHLMMCYIGKVRTSGGLIEKQIQYAKENRPSTLEGMKRIYTLVHDMKSALLRANLNEFGELLHEGFVHKKRMNPGITEGTQADELYELARRHGAIGGKLMGAGGGGYLLLYCQTHRQPDVREALERAGGAVSNFAFDLRGLQVWHTRCL